MATETVTSVRIPGRFNGPPQSANGGYACGYVAALLPDAPAVAVRLHAPPPMDVDLPAALAADGTAVTVHDVDGTTTVATACAAEPLDGLEPPLRPSVADARAAMRAHPWLGERHMLSECFVCSPYRHDGLGLHFGPLAAAPGVNGAVLIGDATLPSAGDVLDPVNVWGALDCPSYVPALVAQDGLPLLGSLHAELLAPVPLGEPVVTVGWHESSDGRKHRTASALLTPDGDVFARARATWVTLPG